MPELETITLTDPSSTMTATFVPGAGMIATSLAEGDDEFLGQRRGLDAYLSNGKTMGIPILYPWANRLSDTTYEADGMSVTLTAGTGGVRTDEHGAPMHGVLAANPDWRVTARSGHELTATLDFDGPRLLASFPFPHVLSLHAELKGRTLTISTTVQPTTEAPVPLCFGYHPYLRIPGVPRGEWQLATPTMRHLPVDERGLPTGAHTEWAGSDRPLGSTTYDDGFDSVPAGSVFSIAGGGRRIDVRFDRGYPAAQLFAPINDDVIGIEPMAAPTDALRRGGYRSAVAGVPDTSRFSITVG